MSEAKEYLRRIKQYDARIDSKLEELVTLKTLITKITPALNDIGGSGGGAKDKLGNNMAKIIDLQNEINSDINTFVDLKREASEKMKQLKNPEHYRLLHARYVQYKTIEQIAVEMNYSWRWVCKLHERALQEFDKILKENAKEDIKIHIAKGV